MQTSTALACRYLQAALSKHRLTELFVFKFLYVCVNNGNSCDVDDVANA